MNYYLISKTDKTFKVENRILLNGGFKFNQKVCINLYDYGMINYVLNRKLTNSLKSIINLYLMCEDDESDERMEALLPKIELLRRILIESYAAFMSESEIESYLTKFDKLEGKIINRGINKKSRSM